MDGLRETLGKRVATRMETLVARAREQTAEKVCPSVHFPKRVDGRRRSDGWAGAALLTVEESAHFTAQPKRA